MIKDIENFNILCSDEDKQFRLNLCNKCENITIIDNINTCDRCACPIDYIIKYKFKECPIGLWKN